jgi:hypothetical protein
MNATIPSLPRDLQTVPGPVAGEVVRGDGQVWRDEWYAWRDRLIKHRRDARIRCDEEHPNHREHRLVERIRCQRDPAYFLAVWGWIHEPRPKTRGSGELAFTPYAFQVELLRWIEQQMAAAPGLGSEGDGLVSKSRDMGATWLFCAYVLHGWLFKKPFNANLISRKEDLVDKPLWPDAMFYKIDYLHDRLPEWLRPPGYVAKLHRFKMTMHNPSNGNVISGESTTTQSGRGGRYTLGLVDEAAFVDDLNLVAGTLVNSTDHLFLVSSESNEKGEDFKERRLYMPRQSVRELDWWLHPDHDEQWYAWQKERAPTPEGFAREVERNPDAGFGEKVYPGSESIVTGDFPYEPGMSYDFSIDPGYDDETAFHLIALDPRTGRHRVFASYMNKHQEPEFYAHVLAGVYADEYDFRSYGVFDTDELMRLTATLPLPTLLCGDPYGGNKVTGRDSWYTKFELAYYRLRQSQMPTGPKAVRKNFLTEARTYQGRRTAFMSLLRVMDFDANPGVERALHSIQTYRFETIDRPRQSEQLTPKHTVASHPVTAFEYWAVNQEMTRIVNVRDLTPYKSGKRKRERFVA